MNNIEFGTDGWRAIIGKEFTSDNVKVVAQAIADYVKHHDLDGRGVVVGYDTRKGSRDFADSVCSVMLGNNIPCYITDRDTPTPVTAFEVLDRKTGGAVMITASHNPPEWNGIKYIPEYAGPALPDVTEELTKRIADVMQTKKVNESSIEQGLETHLLSSIDPTASYIEFVRRQLDIETIQKARLRIVCDCMHGTSRGYLSRILESVGCEVTTIHDEPDPKFGGSRPEPLPEFLGDLKARVAGANAELGLATDGDADRLAAYDSDGNYFGADQLFPMLYEFIVRSGYLGGVVRTVATTHLVDRIAEKYGLPVYEVPVGFKYVGKYLREKDVAMGGEESGGLSFKGHISEKDGIMTGVKITEMCAKTK
jgi:phosphomannomutase